MTTEPRPLEVGECVIRFADTLDSHLPLHRIPIGVIDYLYAGRAVVRYESGRLVDCVVDNLIRVRPATPAEVEAHLKGQADGTA